jgi:Flp pilus assembly protein TadG
MRRLGGSDEGAFAVLFAIVMSAVLFGIGAIVVDVGGIYAESRQLQNAADATVLAATEDCASNAACTSAGERVAVATLADLNSNDATSTVSEVCGRGAALSSCAASAAAPARWDCGPVPATGNFVQVRVATRRPGGSALLPPRFSRALPGRGAYAGTSVRACARAAWGAPSFINGVLPLTFSVCEYNSFTSNGTIFQPAGPYPSPTPWPVEKAIYFHQTTLAPHCGQGPSGADVPGGFGWLTPGSGCQLAEVVGGWYSDSTGRSAPSGCDIASLVGKVIDIPIYDALTGTGSNAKYELKGFAPFFLTGYYAQASDKVASMVDGKTKCPSNSASDSCIKGFFTHDLVPASGSIGPGPGLGTIVVQLTG